MKSETRITKSVKKKTAAKPTNASGVDSKALVRLARFLQRGQATIEPRDNGRLELTVDGMVQIVASALVVEAVSAGLIVREGSALKAKHEAKAFLDRAAVGQEESWLAQHADVKSITVRKDGVSHRLRLNRSESPLAALVHLKDRTGAAFLPEEALTAGERLASDFTRGRLQPRVTASWDFHLAGTTKGERGGMAELTDSAVAARRAVSRAVEAMGPELAGVALDVCCFMKGLELVERERQWPARSAKLMLRTALMALSRHYTPPPAQSGSLRAWGAEDYRPEL